MLFYTVTAWCRCPLLQHVIEAVQLAANAVDELARMGSIDRVSLQATCEQFIQNVQVRDCSAICSDTYPIHTA